ncbi:hypothetical protein ACHQM5_024659 [Ranunculus cassubicifolius]
MGGICSSTGFSNHKFNSSSSSFNQQQQQQHADFDFISSKTPTPMDYHSGELGIPSARFTSTSPLSNYNKVPAGSRASIILGLGSRAVVEVFDTLGSSMSNLNPNSGFISGITSRGDHKISILAFEVANTIVKGANLLHSLSTQNIHFLRHQIFSSIGVQLLVSTDMDEFIKIAAADKREEFDVFSREVVRFGDKCKDPQWHNLGRYFSKLDSDSTTHNEFKQEAQKTLQQLTTFAQLTAELYHELHALDRYEQDYRRKLDEVESLHLPRRGESLMILRSELKHQRKLVRDLKKKSLWSKNLEEVMEKLVDVLCFIHQEIVEAFGKNDTTIAGKNSDWSAQRLGVSGLALHYANIINQIDNIVSRPTSLPPNLRDTLYHGLPAGVKVALRSGLLVFNSQKQELTVEYIKGEMEKTLQWLVPIAANTIKAHQGFGWVGEWANSGHEYNNNKTTLGGGLIRLQTLYHAERDKTDSYVLQLVIWLHHLITQVRQRDYGSMMKPTPPRLLDNSKRSDSRLSQVERAMLEDVSSSSRKLNPGISKSQEFSTVKKNKKTKGGSLGFRSRSSGSSPLRSIGGGGQENSSNLLDVMDGLHTTP